MTTIGKHPNLATNRNSSSSDHLRQEKKQQLLHTPYSKNNVMQRRGSRSGRSICRSVTNLVQNSIHGIQDSGMERFAEAKENMYDKSSDLLYLHFVLHLFHQTLRESIG